MDYTVRIIVPWFQVEVVVIILLRERTFLEKNNNCGVSVKTMKSFGWCLWQICAENFLFSSVSLQVVITNLRISEQSWFFFSILIFFH